MSPTNHPKEILAATIKTLDTREVLMEDDMCEALVGGSDESLSRFSFESVNRDIIIPSTADSYDNIAFVGDIQTEMEELGLLEWGDASGR